MIDLSEKVVLITGAGSGLGAAIARAFGSHGSRVVCLDIRREAAEEVASSLRSDGVAAIALECNVAEEHSVAACVDRALEEHGSVDIAVSCAAIDHTLAVAEMSVEQWDAVIGVNLRGPFLVSRAVLPTMRARGYGHIVNIASTAATRAWANASAYHASKWGLVGFSRGLGVEGREHGIRVTTVIPGGMRTHFFDRFEELGIPMPLEENLQDPANVAEVVITACRLPRDSALQEVIVTPVTETSWP